MSGVTLDAGAPIALDRDDRKVLVLLARAKELGARVTVPATAMAQPSGAQRRPAAQARLIRYRRAIYLAALHGLAAAAKHQRC